jgi:ZIP family zinc transporter
MIGAVAAFLAEIPLSIIAVILAFFTGEFLYLGATDLLPEAHRHRVSFKLLFATILGIAVIYTTTQLLHTVG